MSSFLCSKFHTVTLALFIAQKDTPEPTIQSVRAIARALRKVNNRSQFLQYGDKPQYIGADISAAFINAQAWIKNSTMGDIHALANCFGYQCDGVESMREYSFIREAIQYSETDEKSSVWDI